MHISSLLQSMLNSVNPVSKQADVQATVQKLVDSAFEQKAAQAKANTTEAIPRPTAPTRPVAPKVVANMIQLQNVQQGTSKIIQLSELRHALELQQQTSAKLSSHDALASLAGMIKKAEKTADEIIAALLQQSFWLIKDTLKDPPEKRKRQQEKQKPSTESEEEALELLEILLEHAEEAEDRVAYLEWARSSVRTAEEQIISIYGSPLPDKVQQRFSICYQALEAFEHGWEAEAILEFLRTVIETKKERQ